MRVLIVEDDEHLRRLVGYQLVEEGHDTTSVSTVHAAIEQLDRLEPDIVLLDLGLPDGTGSDVLEALQERRSAAHVIVLSGAGAEDDRIRALKAGADDYLVKPFSVVEVAARIDAVARRRRPASSRLAYGSLVVDRQARRVEHDGAEVELTAREFDLLAFLAARPGQAFTRDELLRSVWESSPEWQQEKTVTEHMRRLRTKLEHDPAQPQMLQTVRGIGYRFEPPAA